MEILEILNQAYLDHINKDKLRKMWQNIIDIEDKLPKNNPYGTIETIELEKEHLIKRMFYTVCYSFVKLGDNILFQPGAKYTTEQRDILNKHADIVLKIKKLAGSKHTALEITKKHTNLEDGKSIDEVSITLFSMIWDIFEHWHDIKDN